MATDQMLSELDTDHHRRMRRDAQRRRRANEDDHDQNLRRKNNTDGRRAARETLSAADRTRIRAADTAAHSSARQPDAVSTNNEHWWVRVSILNSNQTAAPLRLLWNRVCKHCGIKVCRPIVPLWYFLIMDRC
jgi:hypothetical protein